MMLKFLKATGLLFVYMGLLTVGLLMWLPKDREPSETSIVLIMLGMMATFPPVMDVIGKWCFRFRGTGAPVPLSELKKSILAINHKNIPVVVTEKNGKLRATWKYLDAKWWDILSKQGITESYTLLMRFDERHHRATLIDIKRSVNWGVGPGAVRFGFFGFRGVSFDVEIGKAWGITERFKVGKVYDYRFKTSEIRNPILNTILQSGWDVQLGIF